MAVVLKGIRIEKTWRVLDQMGHDAEEMVAFSFQGFMKHKGEFLRSSEEKGKTLEKAGKELTRIVLEKSVANPRELELYATQLLMAGHFEKIRHNLDKVNEAVWIKIREGTLFSDKAVAELKFLFNACQECLRHLQDILATQNPVLMKYLLERAQFFRDRGNVFAMEHEERLAKGTCIPKFSSLYLVILDSLKDVLWNISNIVNELRDLVDEV